MKRIKLYKILGILCITLAISGCGKEANADIGAPLESSQVEEVHQGENEEASVSESETEHEENTDANKENSEDTKTPQYPLVARPSSTDTIEFAFDSEGIYCIYNGEKYGYMTNGGTEITEYIYDYATPFSEGLACVVKDGKYGFIDKEGATVLPFIYDDAAPFSEGLAYFVADGKYGFMKTDGTVAFYLDCDSVSSFKEGLAYFSIDGKYGYIDTTGEVVIEPVYFDADYFEDGLAKISLGGYVGIINSCGEVIVPAEYDSVFLKDKYLIGEHNDTYDCYRMDGVKVLPDSYEYIKIAGNNYLVQKEGLYGVMNAKGEFLVSPQYEVLSWIAGTDKLIARSEFLYGLIDMQGNELVPFLYDSMDWFSADDGSAVEMLRVSIDGKFGYLSLTDFSVLIPLEYEFLYGFVDGKAIAKKDSGYGVIVEDGEIYIPLTYENISQLDNGAVSTMKNDQLEIYNQANELIYSGEGQYVSWKAEGYYCITTENGYIFLDENGIQFYNIEFDYATNAYNSYNADVLQKYVFESGKDCMIKFQSGEEADLTEVILTNKITPRITQYWQIDSLPEGTAKEAYESGDWGWQETYKLFKIANCDFPVLYCYASSYTYYMSDSALFVLDGEELKRLAFGEACGGSAGGDYVTLWRDELTGEIVFGLQGAAGGFGGYARYGEVLHYSEGKAEISFSYEMIIQPASYYEEDELLKEPELFYDGEGCDVPHTAETIMQEGAVVAEYLINGERVTLEEYEVAISRYKSIEIY